MISIVGLEFSYTQAPKNMKSLVMAFYLLAVFLGNIFTAQINHFIQIPSSADEQFAALVASQKPELLKDARNAILPGYDQITGTGDDLVARLSGGALKSIEFPEETQQALDKAAQVVITMAQSRKNKLPQVNEVGAEKLGRDPWGNPIEYAITSQNSCRLISAGPDKTRGTKWDIGLTIQITQPAGPREASWSDRFHPQQTWLENRGRELGVETKKESSTTYDKSYFSGGQTKLEGQRYYRFFTVLMLVFAVLYIPFAMLYRPKAYLHE
jgi:POT family proton-dependent oligopeptide transporter